MRTSPYFLKINAKSLFSVLFIGRVLAGGYYHVFERYHDFAVKIIYFLNTWFLLQNHDNALNHDNDFQWEKALSGERGATDRVTLLRLFLVGNDIENMKNVFYGNCILFISLKSNIENQKIMRIRESWFSHGVALPLKFVDSFQRTLFQRILILPYRFSNML